MSPLAAGTIVAKNHLPFARVLAGSFRRHHPDIPFFVLLADEVDSRFAPEAEPFRLVRLDELAIPDLPRFRFHYSQQELTYASTPWLLAHLLDRGFAAAAFFKQESLVVGDLSPVLEWLDRRAIVLTPHLSAPLAGCERAPRELNILQVGVYNVGFLGVSGTPAARRFLAWWQDRVYSHCRLAVAQGMHYEQRWLDLVPAYFEDVHIVRDPGFNVGHWNLPERDVQVRPDGILVDGRPGRFFRFSGFEPARPSAVTRHSPRLTLENVGPAAALFRRYLELLEAAGYRETRAWPYAYDRFDNGVPIPGIARQIHQDLGSAADRFGDPFQTAPPHSFFRWLNQPADDRPAGSRAVTRLWRAVYEQRVDLQRAYPDLQGADREAFLEWAARHGMGEHGIPERFLGV